MTNSTQEREAAARARCDAATKGPWEHTFNRSRGRIHSVTEKIPGGFGRLVAQGPLVQEGTRSFRRGKYTADARFIAHARTDLPRSLDENQRLRDQLIGAWTHTALKCPCSPRQLEGDTDRPAPPDECTCGLKEALYG